MAGTLAGGKKAAETNKRKYGENWYKLLGQKGGKRKVPKGFAINKELAREAGRKGGLVSRRGR